MTTSQTERAEAPSEGAASVRMAEFLELHARLAARGHPDLRPAHGYAFQAIGSGATASELARRLGVTKRAAATNGRAAWEPPSSRVPPTLELLAELYGRGGSLRPVW